LDLGYLGRQRLSALVGRRRGVRVGRQGAFQRGEGRTIDLLAEIAPSGVTLLEGAAYRFFECVQASVPPQGGLVHPWLALPGPSINRDAHAGLWTRVTIVVSPPTPIGFADHLPPVRRRGDCICAVIPEAGAERRLSGTH